MGRNRRFIGCVRVTPAAVSSACDEKTPQHKLARPSLREPAGENIPAHDLEEMLENRATPECVYSGKPHNRAGADMPFKCEPFMVVSGS